MVWLQGYHFKYASRYTPSGGGGRSLGIMDCYIICAIVLNSRPTHLNTLQFSRIIALLSRKIIYAEASSHLKEYSMCRLPNGANVLRKCNCSKALHVNGGALEFEMTLRFTGSSLCYLPLLSQLELSFSTRGLALTADIEVIFRL